MQATRLLSTLVLSALVFCACTKKNNDEIVIGEYGSMTGSEATFGQATDQGVGLAVEEINAAGGIKGKKIRVIALDDQGKAEDAASVVTRLIEQDNAIAIIGEVASSRTLAAAPIAQAKKIPMVAPGATNPKVTEIGDYIFRTCFIDPFQGTVMAKFAYENLKLRKIAILRDVKSDYSVGLADYFIQKFKELGGEIVGDASYQAGDVDFKAQLTSLKGANPDGLFIPGYYTEVGLIARQTRELGLKAKLLGGDGWDSPKLSEIGGKDIDGGVFANHFSNETTEPVAVEFMKKFKAKYNRMPDGLSAIGYDSAKVLFKAIQDAPELTSTAIRDQLAKTVNFPGVTGKITINEKRNAVKSAVVVEVQGPINKYVTTVNP